MRHRHPVQCTVDNGQVTAHMLFDWFGNIDIDVYEVGKFGPSPMHTGTQQTDDPWSGDGANIWTFISTDWDNGGINSAGMIDGPFIGFNANSTCWWRPVPRPSPRPGAQQDNSAPERELGPVNIESLSSTAVAAQALCQCSACPASPCRGADRSE